MKIDIFDVNKRVIYSHYQDNNNIKLTLDSAKRANIDLYEVNLIGADLSEFDFSGIVLINSNFTNANLSNSNFKNSCLDGSNFTGVNLTAVNFSKSRITKSIFPNANLTNSDLSFCNLTSSDFTLATLTDVNLSNSKLNFVTGNEKEIKNSNDFKWPITFTASFLSIGCKQFSFDQWLNLTENQIASFDPTALAGWLLNKDRILELKPK